MRNVDDGEKKKKNKRKKNGENSGPLTSLPVDRLTATDCNAATRAKIKDIMSQDIKYHQIFTVNRTPTHVSVTAIGVRG